MEVRVSEREVEDFIESNIWKNMMEDIITRRELVRSDLEKADNIEKVRELQGEVKSLIWIANLPQLLLRDLKEELGQEPETPEEDEDDGKHRDSRDGRDPGDLL